MQQQDVRYRTRIGGEQPYRDDPLESFAHAGLRSPGSAGGTNYTNTNTTLGSGATMMDMDDDNKKERGFSSSSSSPLSPLSPITKGLPDCASGCGSCCSLTNRTREDEGPNGRYYRDNFNDYSWKCSLGTTDEDGIWLNQHDPAGTIMCIMVWILLGYSCLTITLLAQTSGIPPYQSFLYAILVSMALACHIKTTFTDPGSVPASAVPTEVLRNTSEKLSMCSQCQTFKPPLSHHCRICNRCISKMDRKLQYSTT